ncbi:MAG: hypothetical protein CO118_08225, partial [Flavobacteriales bacterium CG_4_9_14_3_um_filter_32_8]
MKILGILIISFSLIFCTPKGPQTYSSPYVGKTKSELIATKGIAKTIKIFDKTEAYIYKTREEYFGKKITLNDQDSSVLPKKVFDIEHIYYINEQGIIYKYQVWKKRI